MKIVKLASLLKNPNTLKHKSMMVHAIKALLASRFGIMEVCAFVHVEDIYLQMEEKLKPSKGSDVMVAETDVTNNAHVWKLNLVLECPSMLQFFFSVCVVSTLKECLLCIKEDGIVAMGF